MTFKPFIWTDIETTGLNAQQDLILAVGLIITDEHMKEIARKEWVVHHSEELMNEVLAEMHPAVLEMHKKNGLLDRVKTSKTDHGTVVHEACEFLDQYLGRPDAEIKNRPPMAGSTVSFDAEFIRENMPELMKRYNYRRLDVSSFKVLALATIPDAKAWEAKQLKDHTPLEDLTGSILELAHWRGEFARDAIEQEKLKTLS
jgi:oligoribonuclease